MTRTLMSHIDEGGFRGSLLASLTGHLLIVVLLLLGVELFEPEIIQLGSGPGGGDGSAVSVGLVGELKSGGAGMVKPSIVPKPEAYPAPPEKKTEPEPPASEPVFERAKPEAKPEPKDWHKKPPPAKEPPKPAPAGVVPSKPEPGSGGAPGGSAGGLGEGTGTGGVSVGAGDGGGGIDSWYVRQVERRIGGNWLKTSLGELKTPVRTRVSFEIAADGQIQAVQVEEPSGISSVDLAARRAVLASNPLPPPPFEMRRRRIKFVAYFEYPPR